MSDLSILCITKAEPCVLPLLEELAQDSRTIGAELVLCADGPRAFNVLKSLDVAYDLRRCYSEGYIESILDDCIRLTNRDYVFRIDDDESLPLSLVAWLKAGRYRESDHWKFNRAHLIEGTGAGFEKGEDDEVRVITTPPLWPDHQTRLSTREKSFGRNHIHCGSPFGGGELAPYPILHHKFVIKSLEERQEIVRRYDEIQPGAGGGFWQFSVPERIEEQGGKLETISYEEFVRRCYAV